MWFIIGAFGGVDLAMVVKIAPKEGIVYFVLNSVVSAFDLPEGKSTYIRRERPGI